MSKFQRKRINWRWIDGELQTFSWNVWKNGEPDNRDDKGERCALYAKSMDAWDDYYCNIRISNGYVCQNLLGK